MNRTGSWRTNGRRVLIMGFALAALGATAWAQMSEKEILNGIDERIEKYRRGDLELELRTGDGALPEGTEVQIEQVRHHFLFGCNLFKLGGCRTAEENEAYARQYSELFNFATLPFYWWNYERVAEQPDYARTEEMIRWCAEHNITPKGHPLAWNYMDPSWLPEDFTKAMDLQFKRIERCAGKFEGQINIWDVVNEATAYQRDVTWKQSPILTGAIKEMGVEEYMRQAFQAAWKAAPNATLLINDYRTDPDYQHKIIEKLKDDEGKPLYDVIGIQSHMHGGYWSVRKTWGVCDRYSQYGVPLHFTELTILSGHKKDDRWQPTNEGDEKAQAEKTVEFYRILFSHPAVEAITWWDFSDQGAWQGAASGMVRDDLNPKPVYTQLKDLIRRQWWTKTSVKTKGEGTASLRGYYGDYRASVKIGDRLYTGTFSLRPKSEKKAHVILRPDPDSDR